ncbi:asparagine synthase (glutamine-hydrolyzing), partial [Autumnicola edwardsiae]
MCGINGVFFKKNKSEKEISGTLSKMNGKIIHRGPDEDGFYAKAKQEFSIGMAMRRLSIIDLSTGKQPMFSEDGKIAIVFNGEIYNYRQLKNDLLKKNVEFLTTSDTEVILRLYEQHGTSSFKMLDGMFAFSIFDENKNKLLITRDFFGEKPLYYANFENKIFWASELKSIMAVADKKPEISKEGLNLYLQLTYIPAPFSIYEGIHKLPPNHYLELDCSNSSTKIVEIENELQTNIDPDISFEEAKRQTHDLVTESVKSRSVADVPLGTFLSGGVDSSIVSLALAQQEENKIDTFSVGFEKKSFDETDKSRVVADIIGSSHHEFIISVDDLKDNINNILLNFDEPFADSSSLPT